ncbi:MAG: helix-turn-helix transcriptional regulator [Gemmatimonadaceae bacterium]|nr:helix-turn-helix transcriptional regulator [Gloeobacterales cyanobacterium ES-bin-141]
MEPTLRSGDVVAVDTGDTLPVLDGLYLLVIGGAPCVRRVHRCAPNRLEILSDNPRYGPILLDITQFGDETAIVGKLLGAVIRL